jgi:hypothetical protein
MAIRKAVEPPTFGLGNRFGCRLINGLRPNVANVLQPFPRHKILIMCPGFVVWRGPLKSLPDEVFGTHRASMMNDNLALISALVRFLS